MKKSTALYRITYRDFLESKNISLKCRKIVDSPLGFSFVALSQFVFDDKNSVLVKPSEESLKKKLEEIKTLHLSIHSVIAIEELSSFPLSFKKDKSKLLILPSRDEKIENPKH